jgi:hypothetical protein
MTDLPPPVAAPTAERPVQPATAARWPLILGGLVGGALLVGAGLGLGWYLFYRPIVNVAVQLPAPPAPPAPPGPDEAQVKALQDQIAVLKDRLRADVCTAKDPQGSKPLIPPGPQQTPIPRPEQKI